ncbi:MAG: hypothetical protein A2Y10_14450 [Planctomycetes bacterium GWF2_41_51]|nr:MAG: hypothetical protein A2Y10_14450 [Planctomycetes bacterium GWF2_41_51]
MIKAFLVLLLTLIVFLIGCQEKKPELIQTLKEKQARQLRNSIVATCEGCDTWAVEYFTPRDIVIARHPSIEQEVYLTVLDDEGNPVTCCEKAMRLRVEADGSLSLNCKTCGKLIPIEVRDHEVIVVQEE